VARAERINAFFLAGAVSLNILLAAVPFVFLLLGLAGFLLPLIDDPQEVVLRFVRTAVSATTGDWGSVELVDDLVRGLIRDRTGVSLLSTVLFIWFATRLAGALRTVLSQTFDLEPSRGVIHGKLFDAAAVLVGTLLVTVNLAVTVFLRTWGSEGLARLGIRGEALSFLESGIVQATGLLAIWIVAVLVYRFMADDRVSWRTAVTAATALTVLHEALKYAFGWYVTSVASYGSVYGNLANLAVLLFWVYYTSSAFVLSGAFAYVWMGMEDEQAAAA
jgi:membrane protein